MLRRISLLIVVTLFATIAVHADPVSLNPNSFTILLAPAFSYALSIATGDATAAELDVSVSYPNQLFLSTGADFSGTALTTATVINSGNVTADWQVSATCVGGWTVDDDGDISDQDADNIVTIAVILSSPSVFGEIGADDFADADQVDGTVSNVGGAGNLHEFGDGTGNSDGNNVTVNGYRSAHYLIMAPYNITDEDNQYLSVTFDGIVASSF